jgi:DNA replication protein DnaC
MEVYECPKCRDEGIIFVPERNVAYPCECIERKKLKRMLKSTNMSEDALHKTFDNFSLEGADPRVVAAYELAREYSDGLVARVRKGHDLRGVPWFGLLGTSGSGKTHLVTATVAPLIKLGVYPLFFNWVQSFTEWFSYYNNPDEAHKVDEIRQRIYNCELLVVDDICKESQKDTWIKEFYGIVDYRYRKQLPIVFTSEYFAELIGYLSKATAGRLFERTVGPKGKMYLGKMLLAEGEDPLALDYRFRKVLSS